jgi:hypothetical protein
MYPAVIRADLPVCFVASPHVARNRNLIYFVHFRLCGAGAVPFAEKLRADWNGKPRRNLEGEYSSLTRLECRPPDANFSQPRTCGLAIARDA